MAIPQGPTARMFYRSAIQRFDDALYLLGDKRKPDTRTTSSVYLAGYAVECLLKALILASVPTKQTNETFQSFRGGWAHDFGELKKCYIKNGGQSIPEGVSRCFYQVNTWGTQLRYRPGAIKRREAEAFIRAAREIIDWADGRL